MMVDFVLLLAGLWSQFHYFIEFRCMLYQGLPARSKRVRYGITTR